MHSMPSDLKPSEKEEREVERLIGRKPAPSRKKAPRRGPKHDNRRRRMDSGDTDLKSDDKDMSLNQKVIGSALQTAARLCAETASQFQSSYEESAGRAMTTKTATYHGVVGQGHPEGPVPGYRSYDKRYFGKEQYASIVTSAKSFLKEDWLTNDWDGGAPDAPFRAALDLAIYTADGSLYQSKVDAETYNMLLARVLGDDTDQFSETFLSNTKASKRSASAMSNARQNLLRIASELRTTDPKAAIEIVRNLRSLIAQEQVQGQQVQGQQVQGQQEVQGQQVQGQQVQGQQEVQGQQVQGQVKEKDMDDFLKGKVDIKDLKAETKKLVDSKDMDDFVEGLKSLAELMKKTAAGRVAIDRKLTVPANLAELEDMDDEQVKAFVDEQRKKAQELMKFLDADDVDQFMDGLDELFKDAEKAAEHVKTSSVRVSISSLVRLAAANPEARAFLMPVLIAAKKKTEKAKKKGKKTSQQDQKAKKKGKKAPKENPFGGKKAPPFVKGKGKGKKASVGIDSSDLSW